MTNPGQCPANPADTAESYLLGHLPPGDTKMWADHILVCAHCTEVLAATDKYLKTIKRAAARLRAS
jgi:hypothetical protein